MEGDEASRWKWLIVDPKTFPIRCQDDFALSRTICLISARIFDKYHGNIKATYISRRGGGKKNHKHINLFSVWLSASIYSLRIASHVWLVLSSFIKFIRTRLIHEKLALKLKQFPNKINWFLPSLKPPTSESLLCSVSWKSGSKSFLLLTSSNARYAAGIHAVNDMTHMENEKEKKRKMNAN